MPALIVFALGIWSLREAKVSAWGTDLGEEKRDKIADRC